MSGGSARARGVRQPGTWAPADFGAVVPGLVARGAPNPDMWGTPADPVRPPDRLVPGRQAQMRGHAGGARRRPGRPGRGAGGSRRRGRRSRASLCWWPACSAEPPTRTSPPRPSRSSAGPASPGSTRPTCTSAGPAPPRSCSAPKPSTAPRSLTAWGSSHRAGSRCRRAPAHAAAGVAVVEVVAGDPQPGASNQQVVGTQAPGPAVISRGTR